METPDSNAPRWTTNHGGEVEVRNGRIEFVTKPDDHVFDLNGTEMPIEWHVLPVNDAARAEYKRICCTANCGCVGHAEDGIPCVHDFIAAYGQPTPAA